MTYKEWFSRQDLISEFASFLSQSTVQTALRVLEEQGKPRARLKPDSPNLMENHALLNARREGYFECLQNLIGLAQPKTLSQEPGPEPWKWASDLET